jgi:hypothetical protein
MRENMGRAFVRALRFRKRATELLDISRYAAPKRHSFRAEEARLVTMMRA